MLTQTSLGLFSTPALHPGTSPLLAALPGAGYLLAGAAALATIAALAAGRPRKGQLAAEARYSRVSETELPLLSQWFPDASCFSCAQPYAIDDEGSVVFGLARSKKGTPLGYVAYRVAHHPKGSQIHLLALYVAPPFRNASLAHSLLEWTASSIVSTLHVKPRKLVVGCAAAGDIAGASPVPLSWLIRSLGEMLAQRFQGLVPVVAQASRLPSVESPSSYSLTHVSR